MSTDQLAPPGSSTYNSNTMHVGDGTWDNGRDSFLLPNLQGLNFATMRYNGMSNRFRELPQYHVLIAGHGALAAITFLGIMPLALFLAKYGNDWPGGRVSFKLHVYLQILTVFLTTVIITLGFFAVGQPRSLSNPHHGIGLAIYVLILFQFIYGSCWFRRERKRTTSPVKLPLTVWLHRLLGRTTALLAFVQIGLGLTLYGSPKVFFILYAVAGALLLFAYLALDYYYKPRSDGSRPGGRQPEFYSDYGSSISGSRTDRPPSEKEKDHHWGRKLLAAGGALGAYKAWKHRRESKREEREEDYEESVDDRQRPPPRMDRPPQGQQQLGPPPTGQPPYGQPPYGQDPYGQAPHGQAPYGQAPYGQAPYGQRSVGPPTGTGGGGRSSSRPPSRSGQPESRSAGSRESWEGEKYSDGSYRPTWRDRMLEATGAFAAYEGVRGLFDRRRKKRDDDYSGDGRYGQSLSGNRNVVDQTDVSRVEAGEAPRSPDTPRVNMGGGQPMTPSMTPSRPPRRPRPSGDSVSYDSRGSFDESRPRGDGDTTFTENVRRMGPISGFKEWNRQRKERREAERAEDVRRQELDNEEQFNRRNSNRYPRPQDASSRRQSMSGSLMTGPSAPDHGNPEMSRTNLRPDTSHPPLPGDAGTIPSSSNNRGSRQNVTNGQGYSLPPPPPGPPPGTQRGDGYGSPQFGSAQMPEGAVNPDPNRLLSDNTTMNEYSAYGRDPPSRDDVATRGIESESPSRPHGSRNKLAKPDRKGSTTSGSMSQLNSEGAGPSGQDNPNSPPVSVKVKMHNDGRHVTLRRLNEEEATAERESRRQDRRNRRRRASSLSSGVEDDPPPGQRYRRTGGVQPSKDRPITNIPPPPAMSSSAGGSYRRDSEQNLPPPPAVPQHSMSPPSAQGLSPPAAPMNESGAGSPGDAGTGTDVSAFADNRRRRRAERARKLEAAAAKGQGRGVEFQ